MTTPIVKVSMGAGPDIEAQLAGFTLSRTGTAPPILTGPGGGEGDALTVVWVSPDGDDSSATGNDEAPFQTIGAALASITDASASKPYLVWLAPGVYTQTGIALKSYVSIAGQTTYGVTINVDSLTYDASYDTSGTAWTGVQSVIFQGDPDLTGDPTIHNPNFTDVIFSAGLTISGAATLGIFRSAIAGEAATIVDVLSVFSRLNTFEGAQTAFNSSQDTDVVWDMDEDRHLFGVILHAVGAGNVLFSADGDIEGPVELTSTQTFFEGTATACGTSVVLTGGALASQYTLDGGGNGVANAALTASGSGKISWKVPDASTTTYTPSVAGNWAGAAPTTVQQALDRIAANTMNTHPIP